MISDNELGSGKSKVVDLDKFFRIFPGCCYLHQRSVATVLYIISILSPPRGDSWESQVGHKQSRYGGLWLVSCDEARLRVDEAWYHSASLYDSLLLLVNSTYLFNDDWWSFLCQAGGLALEKREEIFDAAPRIICCLAFR